MEVEVVDHLLIEQAEDVGARADHEALVRERPLEGAGAAEPLAALEHEDGPAGPGQVGRRGQAVVAAADDDRVPVPGGELRDRRRQADLAELGCDLVHRGHHPRFAPQPQSRSASAGCSGPAGGQKHTHMVRFLPPGSGPAQLGSAAPSSARTASAALRPFRAITLPAGWVAAPHM